MLEAGSTLYAVRRSPARPESGYTRYEDQVNAVEDVASGSLNWSAEPADVRNRDDRITHTTILRHHSAQAGRWNFLRFGGCQ